MSTGYDGWRPCTTLRRPTLRRAHCGAAGIQSESLSLAKKASPAQRTKQWEVPDGTARSVPRECRRRPRPPQAAQGGAGCPGETCSCSSGTCSGARGCPARARTAVQQLRSCRERPPAPQRPFSLRRKERPGGCLCGHPPHPPPHPCTPQPQARPPEEASPGNRGMTPKAAPPRPDKHHLSAPPTALRALGPCTKAWPQRLLVLQLRASAVTSPCLCFFIFL